MIFRGWECPAKCQRCLTGAHYDHAALLIKNKNLLQVYESNGQSGVKLRYWHEFSLCNWYYYYEKFVYRRLEIDLEGKAKEEFLTKFSETMKSFIEQTQGKKYTLSIKKILFKNTTYNEQAGYWKKADGFFCSQLVAAALMNSGVLVASRASGNFLPGDFSDSNDLEMYPGLRYSEEYILDVTSS